MWHSTDDPATMTPDERRREIASILARGILRTHCMRQIDPVPGLIRKSIPILPSPIGHRRV